MREPTSERPYRVTVEVKVWADSPEAAMARAADVCSSRSRHVRYPTVLVVEPWEGAESRKDMEWTEHLAAHEADE